MAEEGTLATNADVLKKAGANASSTSSAEAYTNVYIKEAEGLLSARARYDFVANYSSISSIGKEALRDAVSGYAAVKVISYDMGEYGNREALIIINILWATWSKVYELMDDTNHTEFILSGQGDIE